MEKVASVERLATGILGMDDVLGGGIPFGTNVLLLGDPGTGKSTFCFQIIKNGLEKGFYCLFVATTHSPEEVISSMELFGLDPKKYVKNKKLDFIDCYSSRLGVLKGTFKILDPSNLNALSLEIEKSMKSLKKPVILVFDSFSDIILKVGPERASNFFSVISARFREIGSIAIFTLVESVHDKKTRISIEFLCDGVIEMNVFEGRRFIKVKKMKMTLHPLGTFEFMIKLKRGIELRELEEFFEH